jgi:hypothetical protein
VIQSNQPLPIRVEVKCVCDGEMSQKRRQTARIELLLWLCSAKMIDEVLQNDAKGKTN